MVPEVQTKEADVDALADFLCKFSVMAAENADIIGEMDINPVIVLEKGKGFKAVDGLIVKKWDNHYLETRDTIYICFYKII